MDTRVKPAHDDRGFAVTEMATKPLDRRRYFRYNYQSRSSRGASGCDPEAERVRRLRAGFATPLPGGFGTPPGRHYDRSARSSLRWDRRGPEAGSHPVLFFQEARPEAERWRSVA